MASNVIYLLGAGASAQKVYNHGNGKIPAIPLAHTFGKTIEFQIGSLISSLFYGEEDVKIKFKEFYKNKLNEFGKFISKYNTIDEGMRFLYLNLDLLKLNEYKNLIDLIFYLLESVQLNYDSRYPQFLLTLVNNKMQLKENIKILSWNYDNQFEHAEKDICGGTSGFILNYNNFHKINGTSSFYSKSEALFTQNKHDIENVAHRIDEIFHQRNSSIDFAWEETPQNKTSIQTKLTKFIKKCPEDESVLVVIGYSFPYVNHEYDLQIIEGLKINKIYYQNKVDYTNVLKERFITGSNYLEDIVYISDCERFYLPNELFLKLD